MTGGLSAAVFALSLALGGWALGLAAVDRLPPKALLQVLFALQGVLVVQAVVAIVRMGDWGGSKGELSGYLAVSALLVPGGLVLSVEERSRYGTLVLAVACLVVGVVQLRLLQVWAARAVMPLGRGAGRLLVAVYAVFALSASSRALLQLLTSFEDAPVAYLLSAVAALTYLLAAYALLRDSRRLATGVVVFELVGVLVVGTLSLVDGDLFPDETVWSAYGSGYAFVPLLLPVLGLLRLRATR